MVLPCISEVAAVSVTYVLTQNPLVVPSDYVESIDYGHDFFLNYNLLMILISLPWGLLGFQKCLYHLQPIL